MTATWRRPAEMVAALANVRMSGVFNPYADHCPDHDLPGAPAIRRRNLLRVLEAAIGSGVDTLWVGQDLGRKGGRRTGLPLTDEPHLARLSRYWEGVEFERATVGPEMTEETARIVWRALEAEPGRVFFWNAFPLQPHRADDPRLNRGHRPDERRQAAAFLPWILAALQPHKIVALGRVAETALAECGVTAQYVRHPGRGGGPEFLAGIARLR